MPKKKSPRKEYISDRMKSNTNRLYLIKSDLPKLSKLKQFFLNLEKDKQKIMTLDLSDSHIITLKIFTDYNINGLFRLNIFTNLKILDLSNTGIKNANMENLINLEVLNVSDNPIHFLSLPSHSKLKKINFSNTKLKKINVSNFKLIEELYLKNTLIENIDIINYPKLRLLDCSFSKLSNFTCQNNPMLENINISKNYDLESIEINNCPKLNYFDCGTCSLKKLILNDMSNLKTLQCNQNKIQKLDCSNLDTLTVLECSDNRFILKKSLILPGNNTLKKLICSKSYINRLDLTEEKNLVNLMCDDNYLETLEVNHISGLKNLECNNNTISMLKVSELKKLESLYCQKNHIETLELINNADLVDLICSWNQLTQLNLQKCLKLKQILCQNNKLKQLDITKNLKLEILNCSQNLMTKLNIQNNILLTFLYCHKNQLTMLNTDENPDLKLINCSDNLLTELKLDNNRKITNLEVINNKLSIPMDYKIAEKGHQSKKYSRITLDYKSHVKKHDLHKIFFSNPNKVYPINISLEQIIPQKLNNCFLNYYTNPSVDNPVTFLIKGHGVIDRNPTMFKIPKGVNVVTLSIAGDVIALSDRVVNTIKEFYMSPKYKIKVPYHCEFDEFQSLLVATKYYRDKFNVCDLESKVYINPLPTYQDLTEFYNKKKLTQNMVLLKQIGWEFIVVTKPYLFKREDKSKIKTPEAKKLEKKLNRFENSFLETRSKLEGRTGIKNIKYNIRNHLEGDSMKDQDIYFFYPGSNCSSNVCSVDMIIDWQKTTPNFNTGRMLYQNCHQFGKFKLSEIIAEHRKGTYIVHACRSISGLRDILSIDRSGLRQESLDYDES